MQATRETDPNLPETPLGTPAWRIALFFPAQGSWSESDYLNLSGGPLVEFDEGHLEVLDRPTKEHQRITQFIFVAIREFLLGQRIGEVFMAPLPMRLWTGKFREPDVLVVRHWRAEYQGSYPEAADLVVEVVSPGNENRRRDLEEKRLEYAKAKIPEYWIIDPEQNGIVVLGLNGEVYEVLGEFGRGQTSSSFELPGFCVSVDACLDSSKGKPMRTASEACLLP